MTVYAIDENKKKAQGAERQNKPSVLTVASALARLEKHPSTVIGGAGAEQAAAFVTRFLSEPALRTKTPTDEEQDMLLPVLAHLDRSVWLTLHGTWQSAEQMMTWGFRGGRHHWDKERRLLQCGPTPISGRELAALIRHSVVLDPKLAPRVSSELKTVPLTLMERIEYAMLADDSSWANELAQELMTLPLKQVSTWSAAQLIGLVDDPDIFAALHQYFGPKTLRHVGINAYLSRAVGRLPADVLEREWVSLLDHGRTDKWTGANAEPYAKALAHIHSGEVARVLAEWVGEKSVAKVATDYFRAHPELAAPALGRVAKGKAKAALVAKALLASLERNEGADVESSAGEATKKASKKAATKNATKRAENDAKGPPPKPASSAEHSLLQRLDAPPWAAKKRAARPTIALTPIVQDERCPAEMKPWTYKPWDNRTAEKDARILSGAQPLTLAAIRYLTDEAALGALAALPRAEHHDHDTYLGWLGERAVPHVIRFIGADLEKNWSMLRRAVSPRLALPVARMASKRSAGNARVASLAWLTEHPSVAALGLVPVILGPDDKDADVAERALRLSMRAGNPEVLAGIARYGADASRALQAWMERDLYLRVPVKMPIKAKWADPERLGTLRFAAGGAMSPAQTTVFLQMLQICEVGEPYQGALDVLAALEATSKTGFAKALLEEFLVTGSPPSHEWVIYALTLLAPAESIAWLSVHMRTWAADGKVALLHRSLESLAALGTDEALTMVFDAGQRSRYDDTRDAVRCILEEVAQARGISVAVLEDLLVPELGLEHGAVELDLGDRKLSVRMGDYLDAVLWDGERRLASFPKRTKSGSSELYDAAKTKFSALKDAAEAVGKTQVLRFERALRSQREWTVADLRAHVLPQPLVGHLARRLVWQVVETGEGVAPLLRIDEELNFVDGNDERVPVPSPDARLVLAHPLRSDGLGAFETWLNDYRVVQPFPQVNRERFVLEGNEGGESQIDRVVGRRAPYLAVLGLTLGMGWKPVPPTSDGITAITRDLPGHLVATLNLSPGLLFGAAKGRPEQTLGTLTLRHREEKARFDSLDPLDLSELLRDVVMLSRH